MKYSYHKSMHSSMVEKRLRHLFSTLPPIKFSIQPHILHQRNLGHLNTHIGPCATTKSWIPTTARCSAHRRPRLRHVIVGPSENPRPCCAYNPYYVYSHYQCTMRDPFHDKKEPVPLENVLKCRGEFYATSLQGALAVMRVVDGKLEVTAVGPMRAVPTVSSCRVFKEYLVEMKGEVLLVFLIYERSLAVVDGVEVFRLDLGKLDWVKVERLRGSTMFLKERCVWIDSVEFGCRDDCVYFVDEGKESKWRVYDFKTCCISWV